MRLHGKIIEGGCLQELQKIINNSYRKKKEVKRESIRKLSNFNVQWTKTLYQNNLNNIAFFFTFFKGYRYDWQSKDYFSWEPEKINVKFHKNCENTGKIL